MNKAFNKKNNHIKHKPLNFSTKNNFWTFFYIKRFLGCLSHEIVMKDNKPLEINGHIYNYHNLFHYEISHLPKIYFGKHKVSGIHGFYSPMFHDCYFEPKYPGLFDESRVAIHEFFTRTSVFSTLKVLNWMFWLVSIKINPILVMCAHTKSIKNYQGDKIFDFQNSKKLSLYSCLQYFLWQGNNPKFLYNFFGYFLGFEFFI